MNNDNTSEKPRSVLVTGGNRGIGYAIARSFVSQGDRVAVTYRQANASVPEGVFGVQADVRDAESLDKAISKVEQEHGPVQVYVANAGITKDTLLMRMSEGDFTDVIDVNLTGAFRGVKSVIKGMIKQRFGRIIFISSISGIVGVAGQTNYCASKAAMVGMARAITRELGSRGITANLVAPGFIDTDMTAKLPEQARKQYLATIPANRFGEVKEVAHTVQWLASEQAAYVSGAIIPVDGGMSMGH